MKSEAGVKKYIYEWLVGLNIGPVYQDRMLLDDKTKLRKERTYIVMDFPDGIADQGPWFRAICVVCIGCKDQKNFIPDLDTLDKVCATFQESFPYNDDKNNVSLIDVQFEDDYPDGSGNHEYRYSFDVFASKG